MPNGKCQMANAKWQMPNGKCQMANAKWWLRARFARTRHLLYREERRAGFRSLQPAGTFGICHLAFGICH
jgi:hypothetical protein